jgi:hypothetical protein
MAVVYSYPLATPESQDLLLGIEKNLTGGEDKPKTRTYTIGSIVDLVEANLPTPAASYWTKTGDNIVNNNIGKVEISAGGNSTWEFAEGVFMYSGNASVYLEENRNVLEFSGSFSRQYFNGDGISLYAPTNTIVSLNSGSTSANKVSINISHQAGGFKINDSRATPRTGIEYGADYSANYTDRSLVDKGYVTSIARPYKVYTALLTQTGINPPVATILENTLGFTPTWLYGGVGIYSIYNVLFTNNKTTVNVFLNINGNTYSFPSTVDSQEITITSVFLAGYTPMNGLLNNTAIEVRVYN